MHQPLQYNVTRARVGLLSKELRGRNERLPHLHPRFVHDRMQTWKLGESLRHRPEGKEASHVVPSHELGNPSK